MPPSGGSGGNTMQTSTSNSTSTTGPNPFLAPQLQKLVNSATGWMDNNMTAPSYFPGGTVAPRTQAELAARDYAWSTGQKGIEGLDSAFNPALSYLSDAASGKFLDPSTNTAYQGWLDASFRPQAEHFRDILAPAIDSKFAGSGRTAGGAHFDTTMRGVQDLERAQADAAAKAGLGLYQGERNLQAGAASALPGVLGVKTGMANNYLDILNRVGAGETGDVQRYLDAANAKHSYESTAQLDWYNRLAQSLLGMYPGGQTEGTSSGTSYGYGGGGGGGGFGSLLGGGLGLAGLGLQAYTAFSDERLKDVEGRVGYTDEGLPLYLYKYKGDDQPRIGPMAQDVAKVKPEAVVPHSSGYLAVDYAQLIPEGGLL